MGGGGGGGGVKKKSNKRSPNLAWPQNAVIAERKQPYIVLQCGALEHAQNA